MPEAKLLFRACEKQALLHCYIAQLLKSKKQFNNSTRFASKTRRAIQQFRPGFSLIEILLSLLFIGALITILLASSGSLLIRRQSNLQSTAARIATKEIERLRGLTYDQLLTQANITDADADSTNNTLFPDIAPPPTGKMPAGSKVNRTIANFQSSPDIKQVTVLVKWPNENNYYLNVSMDTLIYENGL